MCPQTTMTTSKSDLEAKEGQIPNESSFLAFVSLLGSLSTRAGSSTREDQGAERKEGAGAAEKADSPQTGWVLYLLGFSCTRHHLLLMCWQKSPELLKRWQSQKQRDPNPPAVSSPARHRPCRLNQSP